jgi:hypothetical protein
MITLSSWAMNSSVLSAYSPFEYLPGAEKSFPHLVGCIVFARVRDHRRSVKAPNQLSVKVIDNRVDVSFAESSVELLYQINILLLFHDGMAFPLLIVLEKPHR